MKRLCATTKREHIEGREKTYEFDGFVDARSKDQEAIWWPADVTISLLLAMAVRLGPEEFVKIVDLRERQGVLNVRRWNGEWGLGLSRGFAVWIVGVPL
jgi:hypothetical protein